MPESLKIINKLITFKLLVIDNTRNHFNQMNILKLLTGIFIVMKLSPECIAQGKFLIHPILSVPAESDPSKDPFNMDSGVAGIGFGMGVQYIYTLTDNGFGIFCGADFLYNGVNESAKEEMKSTYEKLYKVTDPDIKYFKLLNFPFSAGISYSIKTKGRLSFYANSGLCLNVLKMTDTVIESDDDKLRVEPDLAGNLGFRAGAGIHFSERITASVNYLGLGRHEINYMISSTDFAWEMEGKQKIDLVLFCLGYQF